MNSIFALLRHLLNGFIVPKSIRAIFFVGLK